QYVEPWTSTSSLLKWLSVFSDTGGGNGGYNVTTTTVGVDNDDDLNNTFLPGTTLAMTMLWTLTCACVACTQALEFVKVAGHVCLIGVRGQPANIDLDPIIVKELTMTGTWGTLPSSWVTTLRLMGTKKLDLEPLITHRIPLSDWERGFELMESQQAIKVLFTDLG
ncbi:MAG: hypothetical protein ACFFAY_14765, partial [Promethearchaeota archaeon]